MAFQFEIDENPTDGVKRIVTEQIDLARSYLTSRGRSRLVRTHEFRKCTKRIRGVLQLARPALGEKQFRLEDKWFRDASKEVAGLRDADVLRQTLAALAESPDAKNREGVESVDTVAAFLSESFPTAVLDNYKEHAMALDRKLATRCDDVVGWRFKKKGFGSLVDSLTKTYARGHKWFAETIRRPVPERLHKWRRSVKFHWYHIRIFEPTWPETLKPYGEVFDDLGEVLGHHHDLEVLRSILASTKPGELDDRAIGTVVQLIDERQALLADTAQAVGSRVYVDSPSAVHDRFKAYVKAWHHQPPSVNSKDGGADVPTEATGPSRAPGLVGQSGADATRYRGRRKPTSASVTSA